MVKNYTRHFKKSIIMIVAPLKKELYRIKKLFRECGKIFSQEKAP